MLANVPADVFISVAAVADWRVSNPSRSKIKKEWIRQRADAEVRAEPRHPRHRRSRPRPPFCVGFAAESDDVIENARRKLAKKKVPLIVANRAQDVFGSDSSELSLIDGHGVTTLPRTNKLAQARRLMTEIASRLG